MEEKSLFDEVDDLINEHFPDEKKEIEEDVFSQEESDDLIIDTPRGKYEIKTIIKEVEICKVYILLAHINGITIPYLACQDGKQTRLLCDEKNAFAKDGEHYECLCMDVKKTIL